MKGLIAEIDGRNMIVITEKGDFVKVKRDIKYGIGDEIQLPASSRKQLYRALSAAAASILICVMLGSGVYAYYTPYSYVSVDINPSLGLSLNRFEKVIDIQPLNEDARKVISTAKPIKYENIDAAMSEILQSAAQNGYLKPDGENGVMVVVSTKAKVEEVKLMNEIKTVSKNELAKVSKNYSVMLEKASVDEYKTAIEHKTSPGKVKLTEKVKALNPSLPEAEVKDMSVKQAMEIIKDKRAMDKAAEKAAKEEFRDKHKVRQPHNENAEASITEDKGKDSKGVVKPGMAKGRVKPSGGSGSTDDGEVHGKAPAKEKTNGTDKNSDKSKKKDETGTNADIKHNDSKDDQHKVDTGDKPGSEGSKNNGSGQDNGNSPDKNGNKDGNGEHDKPDGNKDRGNDGSKGGKNK